MSRTAMYGPSGRPERAGWTDLLLAAVALYGVVSGLRYTRGRDIPTGDPVEVRAVVTHLDNTRWYLRRTYMTPMQSFTLRLRTLDGEPLTFAFRRDRYTVGYWPRTVGPGDTLRILYRRKGDETRYPAAAIDEVHRGDEVILPITLAYSLREYGYSRRKSLWGELCMGVLAILWLRARWFPTERALATRRQSPPTAIRGVR